MRHAGEAPVERVDGARVVRLPLAHRRGAGPARMLVEYLGFTALASAVVAMLVARERHDVVQVNNPPDFLIAAALVPKLLGSRIVFDVHDLSPDMFSMRFRRGRGLRVADAFLRGLERLAGRVADVVVTVHEPYRAELEHRGIPAAKLAVVMNTVDERLLPPGGGAREDAFRVVYHGTVTPHYGVALAVEAAARLRNEIPDLRLEIYGEGDALAGLRRRAEELGVSGRVTFSETYLPQRDVLARVRGAAAGIVPNLPNALNRFALSSKLFEYVALGVPVVSADLPTLRAHFSDDEVAFFRAGDAGALAAALLDVYRNRASALSRAAAASRRYDEYRWPANESRYLRALGAAPER
jgi:glycosyltransferase involved in cell wall biosynthesis